jgi:hypothetical protein
MYISVLYKKRYNNNAVRLDGDSISREVLHMHTLLDFPFAVEASVVGYCICKWLDRNP